MSYPYTNDHPNVVEPDDNLSTPDQLAEVYQTDPVVDVKGEVKIVGPVRVQHLPSRHGNGMNTSLIESIAQPLVGANPRRRRIVILAMAPSGSTSRGFYIGDRDDVAALRAALWPYNVPLTLENTEQLYVMPDGTGLATGHIISYIAEDWAD